MADGSSKHSENALTETDPSDPAGPPSDPESPAEVPGVQRRLLRAELQRLVYPHRALDFLP